MIVLTETFQLFKFLSRIDFLILIFILKFFHNIFVSSLFSAPNRRTIDRIMAQDERLVIAEGWIILKG